VKGKSKQKGVTGREAYNIVSDTVTGVNFRRRDNIFQLKFILVTMALAMLVAGILWGIAGVIVGAFAGMVVGLLLSGLLLALFRLFRHASGEHD
jgi:hypothetical protein